MATAINSELEHQPPGYDDRFGGTARLYGQQGLARLKSAKVAVIGIGGVGSWAAEALARSGVGHIVLIDLDDICVTNTNRLSNYLKKSTKIMTICNIYKK